METLTQGGKGLILGHKVSLVSSVSGQSIDCEALFPTEFNSFESDPFIYTDI